MHGGVRGASKATGGIAMRRGAQLNACMHAFAGRSVPHAPQRGVEHHHPL